MRYLVSMSRIEGGMAKVWEWFDSRLEAWNFAVGLIQMKRWETGWSVCIGPETGGCVQFFTSMKRYHHGKIFVIQHFHKGKSKFLDQI